MSPELELSIRIGVPVLALVVTYLTGTAIERRHYRRIRRREQQARQLPVVTFREPPPDWRVSDASLVTGSVVVSLDYFKRFLAGLRALVGGRVRSYESLLDRARREALLRMTETAMASGYQAVVNVRLETSRLASSRRNGEGTAGVEVLAFGTALKLGR